MGEIKHRRFFISPEAFKEDKVYITNKGDINRIITVLRLGKGDELIIFDGVGNEYSGIISTVEKKGIEFRITDMCRQIKSSKLSKEIILVQGIPKGQKMDLVVDVGTELGLSRIIPVITERTVPNGVSSQKFSRWQRIAISSATQSRRDTIPTIELAQNFFKAVDDLHTDLKILLWEGEKQTRLRDVLMKTSSPKSIAICIGPEGGFSLQEVNYAKKNGIIPVSVGSQLLRTEIAGLIALIITLYAFGELG